MPKEKRRDRFECSPYAALLLVTICPIIQREKSYTFATFGIRSDAEHRRSGESGERRSGRGEITSKFKLGTKCLKPFACRRINNLSLCLLVQTNDTERDEKSPSEFSSQAECITLAAAAAAAVVAVSAVCRTNLYRCRFLSHALPRHPSPLSTMHILHVLPSSPARLFFHFQFYIFCAPSPLRRPPALKQASK